MSRWEKFRKAYGAPTRNREFSSADRQRLKGIIPEWLMELWKTDGWASYGGGLFWTVDPEEFAPLVELWKPPLLPLYVVARTAFGSLLMLHNYVAEGDEYEDDDEGEDEEALVVFELAPLTSSFSMVGADAEFFLSDQVAEPSYMQDVYWSSRAKAVAERVGSLQWDEMYGFEPALALGGSGELETVRRVKLFEHHLLLSQLDELKFEKY